LIEKIKFYLYQDVDKEVIKVKNLKRIEDFSVDKIMNQFKKVLEIE
jgi:hypothetical protein